MKNFKILLFLGLLIGMTMTQAAPVDVTTMVDYGKECFSKIPVDSHYIGYAVTAAPLLILSSNINQNMIDDLKLKFGNIKLITVVVEAPVYDIDKIPFADLIKFKELGLDIHTLTNTQLEIDSRKEILLELQKFRDTDKNDIAGDLNVRYTGEELEPGERYQFLAKRPDRALIKMLLPLAKDGHIDSFAEKAIKNLIVGGDTEALDDGIVYMGVVTQLKSMIAPAQSFLSKA